MKITKILKQNDIIKMSCEFPDTTDRRCKFIVQSINKPLIKRTLYSLPSANKIYKEMN